MLKGDLFRSDSFKQPRNMSTWRSMSTPIPKSQDSALGLTLTGFNNPGVEGLASNPITNNAGLEFIARNILRFTQRIRNKYKNSYLNRKNT